MRLIVAILSFFTVNVAFGARETWLDPKSQAVTILYSGEQTKGNGAGRKQWKAICGRLGRKLLRGVKAGGIFKTYTCEYLKDLGKIGHDGQWVVAIDDRESILTLNLFFQSNSEKIKVQAFTFANHSRFLKRFKTNETFTTDLAALIINALPIGSWFSYSDEKSLFKINQTTELPKSLTVFRIAFDSVKKIWILELKASLKIVPSPKDTTGIYYGVNATWTPLVRNQIYWVKELGEEGRLKKINTYKDNLQSELGKLSAFDLLNQLFLSTMSSNYFGIRYGKSFLLGDSVATQSSMMSLVLQMRSGFFSGLHIFYDYIPKVERTDELSKQHFLMKRLSLGWSFDYILPTAFRAFISRIDLQPKFGLFDVDYLEVEVAKSGRTSTTPFKTKNSLDFGLELGIERSSSWMLNRVWASYNSAKIGMSNTTKLSVVSRKAGADTIFNIWEGSSAKVGFLAFGLFEDVLMSRDPDDAVAGDIFRHLFQPLLRWRRLYTFMVKTR